MSLPCNSWGFLCGIPSACFYPLALIKDWTDILFGLWNWADWDGENRIRKKLTENELKVLLPLHYLCMLIICSKCQWSHSVLISRSVTQWQPQSSCMLSHPSFQNSFIIISCFLFFLEHLWLWKTVATGHRCVVPIFALHFSVIWGYTSSPEQSMETIYDSIWREST